MLIIMATTMNDGKEHFTKENILICWNGKNIGSDISYADHLIAEDYMVVTSYPDFVEKFNKSATKNDLKENVDKRNTKKKPIKENIAGIVVLCELTWGLGYKNQNQTSALLAMSGIDFVMELRKNNCILPIVFVSFLSREQQLILSSRNEIISTPILGHYYQQLPSEPNEWINTLNHAKKVELTAIELEDVKSHFCNSEGMLRELNHDLRKYLDSTKPIEERSQQFEYVFKKIKDIIGPTSDQVIEKLKIENHIEDEDYEEKIKKVSVSIEELIKAIKTETLPVINQTNNYKVIFLDDEMSKDHRLKKLVELMGKNGFVVQTFTDPDKALEEVTADKDNLIDLIISDHRIWNQSVNPKLMDQPQGYSFLKACAGLHRTYTYVVFSALPRNFLMTQFGLNTKTLYKNGVLANESSMLNFIQNLLEWGEENKNNSNAFKNYKEVFKKCYNWYKDNRRTEEIDSKVVALVQPIINEFNVFQKKLPENCISRSGESCEGCKIFQILGHRKDNKNFIHTLSNLKAEYKLPEDWDPTNGDHIQNLVVKFAARHLYLYFFYNLRKFNCRLADDIADNLVEHGKIRFEFDKNLTIGHDPKDKINSLMDTARYIWIKKNNLHFTPEERAFLKSFNLL